MHQRVIQYRSTQYHYTRKFYASIFTAHRIELLLLVPENYVNESRSQKKDEQIKFSPITNKSMTKRDIL